MIMLAGYGDHWQLSGRADTECVWLPRRIIKRDPDAIAAAVSGDGYINKVWVNDFYNGIPPDELVGLNVSDILVHPCKEWVSDIISEVLIDGNIVRETITLNIPVSHPRRRVRILRLDKGQVLAYIVKMQG